MEAGYLGVGAMGQPMATKLLDGGHQLTILDANPEAMRPLLDRQARQAATPKDLADQCEIVFISLPTLGAFRAVVFGDNGLLLGNKLKILVNTCTVGVKFLREVEAAMPAKGPSGHGRARCRSWSPAIPRRWKPCGHYCRSGVQR